MVVCDVNYVSDDKEWVVTSNIKNDTNDIKKVMYNIYPAAWNKIFKKEILVNNKIYFKEGVWFEDVEFIYRMLPYIKSIGVVKEDFNQYVQRAGSISNTVNMKLYHYIDNMNGVIDFYKERKLYNEYQKELEYAYVRYIYATFIRSVKKFDYKEYLKAVDKAVTNVKEHFPKYRRNKYFYKSLKGLYLVCFNKLVAKILYRI
jgi:hypothetical protein